MKVLNKNTSNDTRTARTAGSNDHNSKRTTVILVAIAVLLIGLFAGLILVQQRQTPQKRADEVGPSCPLDGFRCTWEKEDGVTYECIIHEVPANGDPLEVARPAVGEDPTTGHGLCTYTPEADKTYSCTVNAVRYPGCEASDTASTHCPVVPPTSTPTPSPSPTPHPQCYVTECDGTDDTTSCAALPNHSCFDTDPSENGEDFRCILNEQCTDAPEGDPASCWCFEPTPTATPTPSPTSTPTPTPHPQCYETTCDGPQDTTSCAGLPNHSCVDTDPSSNAEDFRCVLNERCVDAPEGDPESCWCFAPTPTPSPTSTPGPTNTPPPGATLTPTPSPTNTPPPGATLTPTPTPTDIVVVNVTNTPTPTEAPVGGPADPTSTPVPTLPVAGIPQATYLILLVGMLVVAVGLAL